MSDGIELTDDEYDTFMAVLAEQRCQHSHADTACPPPPERAILQDLIAGLRKSITDVCGDSLYAEGINMDFYFRDQITRAEARLREVTDE